jgi:non-ribosomal peptide synthetase component E (peptide arylation enzyme)
MSNRLILKELSRYQTGTFADLIYRNALLNPDGEAFVCGSRRIGFRRFNERVNSLIHGLETLGVKKGEVIGILSWNRLEYPEVFGAAMKSRDNADVLGSCGQPCIGVMSGLSTTMTRTCCPAG